MKKMVMIVVSLLTAACASSVDSGPAYSAECDGADHRTRCEAYMVFAGPDGRDLDKAYGLTSSCSGTPWLRNADGDVVLRSNGREDCVTIEYGITCCPPAGSLDARFSNEAL